MILKTKLFKPIIHRNYVDRTEITQIIDRGVLGPLLLVSAPSGYGKSTAVSAFLSQSKIPSVWISLGPEENNLPLFVEYLITAVKQVIPDFGADTLGLIHTPEPVRDDVIIAHLVNDFFKLQDHLIIVFDDFHHIDNLSSTKLIRELVSYPSIYMHLVIITRRDPILPISDYRTKGALTEIRVRDLKFNSNYTGAFLREHLQEEVPKEIIHSVQKKLDGWIAGLNLLLLGGSSLRSIQEHLNLDSNDTLAIKRIVDNALKEQPIETRNAILILSLFEEFTAELCEAVNADLNQELIGRKVIDYLQNSSLFIIDLDYAGNWFRYHHLFRDIIRSILTDYYSDAEIKLFHRKAAEWFETQSDPYRAITHYLKAGEMQAAIELFEPIRKKLLSIGAWRQIEQIFYLFPESIVESTVTLYLAKNWILAIQANFSAHIQSVMATGFEPEKMDESGDYEPNILGECYIMSSSLLFHLGGDEDKLMHFINRSLELQDGSNNYAYGLAVTMKALTLRIHERKEHGLKVFQDYLKPGYGSRFDTWVLIGMALFHWMELDIDRLEVAGKQLLNIGKTKNFTEAETSGLYFCGLFHYSRNDFSRAKEFFESCYSKRYMSFSNPRLGNYLALSKTYLALGEISNAKMVINELRENASNDGNTYLVNVAMAGMAEIYLRSSNKTEIVKWVNNLEDHALIQPHGFFHPRLTHIKALLFLGEPSHLEKAKVLLKQWSQFIHYSKPKNTYIETYLTQAWMDILEGDNHSAINGIESAMALAEESGCISEFLGINPAISELIASHSKSFDKYSIFKSIQYSADILEADGGTLLSSRELDIIELLPQRITNKEIGVQLFITEDTVKKHLTSIFKKLEVKNRRTAVQKAQEKGIIS